MKVLYVLAQYDYFLKSGRGRVSHAVGFTSGVVGNNGSVSLLTGPGAFNYFDKIEGVSFLYKKDIWRPFWYFYFIFLYLANVTNSDVVVIRWKPLWFLAIGFLYFHKKKVWFEVNSLTGIDSKNIFVRWLTRLSVFFVTKSFNIITVTEKSMDVISNISRPRYSTAIVPNGFDSNVFQPFSPIVSKSDEVNLAYFGRRQDYYDWGLVYDAVERLSKDMGRDILLHVFGFSEMVPKKGVRFYGPFRDQQKMLTTLSSINRPIMIIPAADSDVAEAGSPIKLHEYASLGVPIIISSSLKTQSRCIRQAFFYKAGYLDDFRSAIDTVSNDYNAYLRKALDGREYIFQTKSWKSVVAGWMDEVNAR